MSAKDAAQRAQAIVQSQGGVHAGHPWDAAKHPRKPVGTAEGGEFAPRGFGGEFYHSGPKDALHSLVLGERVNVQPDEVHELLHRAARFKGDPDLTDVRVNGMLPFGGNGLGIARKDMPQIPKEHRESFFASLRAKGVAVTPETVSPLILGPSQKEISARRVGIMVEKYEKNKNRPFPPVLVSNDNCILDGHHHWGMMAALAIENRSTRMPIMRLNVGHAQALQLMHDYDRQHHIMRQAIDNYR